MGVSRTPYGDRPRTDILGLEVDAIDMDLALETLERWIEARRREYVCVATVHNVMQGKRSAEFREICNRAGMVTPDGMPLVWLSRARGHQHVRRVYGPDLMLALMHRLAPSRRRHFLYGGADGVADRLAESLRARLPGVEITGVMTPPFAPVEALADDATAARINAATPDVVWVGLSTPKQEIWMARMRQRLDAPVLIGVGAAFDMHSGTVAQAPIWMQRGGLEWLFRLSQEPGRLWHRYLVDNPWFVAELVRERLRPGGRRPG
ncbi:MAG: WecB/TagA/CpsF family glycosyltransferase [Candidatus Dormibacteria bacterium]